MFRSLLRSAVRASAVAAGTRAVSVAAFTASASTGGAASWLTLVGVGALATGALWSTSDAAAASVDYKAVRKAIADVLDEDGYDDGSIAPLLIRLAWHGSGSYDKATNTGGSNGATIRFAPEKDFDANKGLAIAVTKLERIKSQFPGITYADLYTLAGAVAVEEMGGPPIKWRPGRVDKIVSDGCPPDGRLPDAALGADHIRAIFSSKGFNDQETVALAGCHAVGRMHPDRSGYDGIWTHAPTTFSNDFFKLLLSEKWTPAKIATGRVQYFNAKKDLVMLPADIALTTDPVYRKYVEEYAANQDKFFADFAVAYAKLLELGVNYPEEASLLSFKRCSA